MPNKAGQDKDIRDLLGDGLQSLPRQEEEPPAATALPPLEEPIARLAIRRGLADIRQGRYRVFDGPALVKLGRDIVSRTALQRRARA